MTITGTTTETRQLPTGVWNIDPSHSSIEFSVRHLMVAKVKGSFKTFSGSVTVPDDPFQSSVQVTIDPTSIDTGDAGRDTHLRSADFFEVDTYPVAEYVSTGVRADGDDYVVEGNLTLHGVTRPVELALGSTASAATRGATPGPGSRPRLRSTGVTSASTSPCRWRPAASWLATRSGSPSKPS